MTSLRVCAVGDISLGDHPLLLGRGVRSVSAKHAPGWLYEGVKDVVSSADLSIANFEGTISEPRSSGSLIDSAFRAADAAVCEMREAGISVASLANNHSFQHGDETYRNTVERLRLHGIRPLDRFGETATLTLKGRRIAVIGASFVPDLAPVRGGNGLGDLLGRIATAAKSHDAVIACCHWGDEMVSNVTVRTTRIAHALVDAGAVLVLGHHPHVLQAVEAYRSGLIAYSLGNFVFDLPWSSAARDTMILCVDLDLRGRAAVGDWSVQPIRIDRQFRPMPARGGARDRILRQLETLGVRQDQVLTKLEGLDDEYAYERLLEQADRRTQTSKLAYVATSFPWLDSRVKREIIRRALSFT